MSASAVPKRAPGQVAPSTEISRAVFHGSPLRHELYRTVHESKLSSEEIAWRLGVSPSYLYRAVLTTTSGVRFPADLLINLMRLCDDYRILGLIARECDHVAVPVKAARRAKKNYAEAVNEIAAGFHALIGDLFAYFAAPAAPAAPAAAAIRSRIRKHMTDLAAVDQAIRTFQQQELF